MVKKAISQMKAGKAPGPSGIMVEMIRAAGDTGASMICDLAVVLPWSRVGEAGRGGPGEGCGRPCQTGGVNWGFPVWLCPRWGHDVCDLCCRTAAGEVSSCQQGAFPGFHGPWEGV